MSDFVVPMVTIAVTVSMVVSLVVCTRCRRKPKMTTSASLVNGHNLLPLNSIRSSDLTTNLELIRYNGVNCMVTDDPDGHHRHTQRALPDIPFAGHPLQHMPSSTANEFDGSRDVVVIVDPIDAKPPKSRSLKPRAPPPPTHRVMSCPAVPPDDDLHHSYARIKDNAVVDSSENETDDYCDPQTVCAVRPVSHAPVDLRTPPVPTKRFITNDLNNDLPFVSSNPSTSRSGQQDMTYMSAPVGHHLLQELNDDIDDTYSADNNRMNGHKSEISYNTISVREPLAKVLADRANSEHHYNEVEEERVSSFYEEIAGSTGSSVTYSKIGDILSNNSNDNNNPLRHSIHGTQDIVTNGPIVHSFDTTDASTSQAHQSLSTITPNCDPFLPNNYPKDLYSSVDKKSKKSYNRQTIHCIPDSDNEFDNLYAKVQKPANLSKDSVFYTNERPSSVSEVDTSLMSDTSSIPPPLPPPLKSFHSNQSRSTRTISLYDSSNSATNSNSNTGSSHQRRYSSGNQSINTNNDWQHNNRDHNSDDYFTYATVGNNETDLESDPGYEVIQRKFANLKASGISSNGLHHHHLNHHPHHHHMDHVQHHPLPSTSTDPAYEAIHYDNEGSDNDPNYEVIVRPIHNRRVNTINTVQINDSMNEMNEISDPMYEVIKRVPQKMQTKQNNNNNNISRNLSDVSSDPGYERIRFTQQQQDYAEPNYASVVYTVTTNELVLSEELDDEIVSERL